MAKNPVLELPLSTVLRSQIAMPLQQILHMYTVGNLLSAWSDPRNHKSIERVFDTPQQARHAMAIFSAWLGVRTIAAPKQEAQWWPQDDQHPIDA